MSDCVWTLWLITVGYTVEDIGVLPGDADSRGLDLNALPNREQVVGTSRTPAPAQPHAVLWEHRPKAAPLLLDLENDACHGAPTSVALGLNNVFPSAVVGSHAVEGANGPTPVLYENIGCTRLPTLPEMSGRPAGHGEARSVSDAKSIVGWSTDATGARLACQWTSQMGVWQVQSLGTLGGPTSAAYRVNQAGTVVGRADIAANVEHAFRWAPGGPMQDIHQGPGSSVALGVNAIDDIVGELDPDGGQGQAFRWTPGGGMQALQGLPGSTRSFATAINDQGVVVGRSDIGGAHAVIWPGGGGQPAASLTAQVLQNPGWQLTRAEAINNRGQITGYGQAPSGEYRGFLLTPVKALIPRLVCPPHLPPTPPRQAPIGLSGSIQVDGGGLVLMPDGRIVHVRPPRPDPLPFVTSPAGVRQSIAFLFSGRSAAEKDAEVGRQVADMAFEVVEVESRRLFESLARGASEAQGPAWGDREEGLEA